MGRNKTGRWWSSRSDEHEYDEPNGSGFVRCDYDQDGNLMGYEHADLGSDRESKGFLLRFREWIFKKNSFKADMKFTPQRYPKVEVTEEGLIERRHTYSYVTAGDDIYDCVEEIDTYELDENEDWETFLNREKGRPHIRNWEEKDLAEDINIDYPLSEQDELIDRYGAQAYFLDENGEPLEWEEE
ncbi:hypothetical protein H6G33_10400 [Calothrix sp. FACHB-1219]|uniref:hypothetical protein n=1 Tax=unclassified Calothrix TaxID=2619626 RepID=UPI0016843D55|nr:MULTISPECIES: hypothetical protein [unclassified Calothrix]MBD2201757.1 hypothetical protein [Calothrix sp. FACHB-168]MBD2217443.1 hypothetical protein [Calothrix sp. FACHB-1219]